MYYQTCSAITTIYFGTFSRNLELTFSIFPPILKHPFFSWWALGYFEFFAIKNNASVNMFSFLLGYTYLGVGLLGHMVTLCLTFWETPRLFPNHHHCFVFPPALDEGSSFSISLPTLNICRLDDSRPNGYEVVLHCGFDFHFPDN